MLPACLLLLIIAVEASQAAHCLAHVTLANAFGGRNATLVRWSGQCIAHTRAQRAAMPACWWCRSGRRLCNVPPPWGPGAAGIIVSNGTAPFGRTTTAAGKLEAESSGGSAMNERSVLAPWDIPCHHYVQAGSAPSLPSRMQPELQPCGWDSRAAASKGVTEVVNAALELVAAMATLT
jgi:hypothetical protein